MVSNALKALWDKRLQTQVAVSLRGKNQNGDIQTGNILLIWNVAVNGDQDFVGAGCGFQEIAIFQSFESCIFDGVHIVAGQVALEMARYALVKQQLHFRAAFPLRVLKSH